MLTRFTKRSLLLGIPFMLIMLLNYIVDPFNYNNAFQIGFDKEAISWRMNYRLFAILKYKEAKIPNILIGDSRTALISTSEIKKVSGDAYFNFSYGSASLPECIETFWYAADLTKLEKVYLGVPFNLFSATNSKNIFSQARRIAASSLDYYLNFYIFRASIYNILYFALHINLASENPNMPRDEFWESLLIASADTYNTYSWPQNYIAELFKIKRYCAKMKITLIIIIPPTHVDLQKQVDVHHLRQEYENYKKSLRSIAPVIDYDTSNDITASRANFKDPYHFNVTVMKRLVREIWGGKSSEGEGNH